MDKIKVEVAFATPKVQSIINVTLTKDNTVQQAIQQSGILKQFSEIDLLKMKVGVYGTLCKLDRTLEQGDRVEIYRPLIHNPMEARRNRAIKARVTDLSL